MNKSYDFTNLSKQRKNNTVLSNGTSNHLPTEGNDQMSQTQYSLVGSRFSGNQTQMLRMGVKGTASPPRMLCYKPRMAESNLIHNLERIVTNESIR